MSKSLLVLILSVGALKAAMAQAQPVETPSVTVSAANRPNASPPETTLTITVNSLGSNERFKDLHLYAAQSMAFPKLGGPSGSVVSVIPQSGTEPPQDWRRERGVGGKRIDLYANNANGFPTGTYTITLQWAADGTAANPTFPITWKATKDGNRDAPRRDGEDIIGGCGGQIAPNLPQILVSLNRGEDLVVALGTETVIPILTEIPFRRACYRIHTSSALAPDYGDALGIGIESLTQPVPSALGFQVANSEGPIDFSRSNGTCPRLLVPVNAALIGQFFYVVMTIENGGDILFSSQPIKVSVGGS